MQFLAAFLILLALGWFLFVLAGCSPRSGTGQVGGRGQAVNVRDMKSLSRDQVRERLGELAAAPVPKLNTVGAMCYEPAMLPTRAEYVCPACGERTVYELGMASTVQEQLPSCRREFQELEKVAGEAVELDESQFCRKCQPEVETPALVLTTTYGDGSEHEVPGVTAGDLRILREFLSGKRVHTTFNDAEQPLKDHLERLEELLGVKLR